MERKMERGHSVRQYRNNKKVIGNLSFGGQNVRAPFKN
jgi:hypothetical protein